MEKYNILIYFKEKILQIENKYFYFDPDNEKLWKDDPDSILAEKVTLNKVKSSYIVRFKEFLKTIININPKLGTINSEPFKVHLKNNTIVACKPYPIAHYLYKPQMKEIES